MFVSIFLVSKSDMHVPKGVYYLQRKQPLCIREKWNDSGEILERKATIERRSLITLDTGHPSKGDATLRLGC
jgi:hypothetical protein